MGFRTNPSNPAFPPTKIGVFLPLAKSEVAVRHTIYCTVCQNKETYNYVVSPGTIWREKNETRPNRRGRQKITPWPAGSWGLWYGRASLFHRFEFQRFLEPSWYVSQFVNDVCRRSCHFLRNDGQILKGLVFDIDEKVLICMKPLGLRKVVFLVTHILKICEKFLKKFRQNIWHFFTRNDIKLLFSTELLKFFDTFFSEQEVQICKDVWWYFMIGFTTKILNLQNFFQNLSTRILIPFTISQNRSFH